MSLFNVFAISGSAMSAQSVRLNTVASNLANANSQSGDPKQVYRAREPVFAAMLNGMDGDPAAVGVRVAGMVEKQTAPTRTYDPGNPLTHRAGSDDTDSVKRRHQFSCLPCAAHAVSISVEEYISGMQLGKR